MTAEPTHAGSERSKRPLIAEPATSLTDLALAGQTLFYATKLRRGPGRQQTSAFLWALAMAAAAIAALAGASTHAIHEDSPSQLVAHTARASSWRIVGLSTSAASAFMLAGSVLGGVPAARRRPYLVATALKAAAAAALGWRTGNYLVTILDYAASMLVVLYLQVRNWRTSAAAPWLTAGILVSFVAAGIQRSGLALHARFNHNDLYHVVQMGAFHLLYEGARREVDEKQGMSRE